MLLEITRIRPLNVAAYPVATDAGGPTQGIAGRRLVPRRLCPRLEERPRQALEERGERLAAERERV